MSMVWWVRVILQSCHKSSLPAHSERRPETDCGREIILSLEVAQVQLLSGQWQLRRPEFKNHSRREATTLVFELGAPNSLTARLFSGHSHPTHSAGSCRFRPLRVLNERSYGRVLAPLGPARIRGCGDHVTI